jgi:hypothetical protein
MNAFNIWLDSVSTALKGRSPSKVPDYFLNIVHELRKFD